MKTEEVLKTITRLIFEKKGNDVKVISLFKVTTLTDYFVICSADSDTQVKAIADHIDHSLRDEGVKVWHKEGYQSLSWVLLDYIDIVVHVFKSESREFYNLEKLWGDAPIEEVKDEIIVKRKPGRPKKVVNKDV